MDKKTERRFEIIELLNKNPKISVKELASILNVSDMTIRRDIQELEKKDLSENGTEEGYNFLHALKYRHDQKKRIGKLAASLIEENDTIILDTGTTVASILEYVDYSKNLTIVSYNANIINQLKDEKKVNMLFAGGTYHHSNQMFESVEGVTFLNGVRANKMFLSAAGVHQKLGLTCTNSYEIPMKKAAMNASSEIILVSLSNKFGEIFSKFFSELDRISVVVTDANISESWVEFFESNEIKILLA